MSVLSNRIRRQFRIVFVLVVLIILSIALLLSFSTKDSLSKEYASGVTKIAQSQFSLINQTVKSTLQQAVQWGQSGLISLDDPTNINKLLLPILRQSDLFSGVTVAEQSGRSYYFSLTDSGSFSRLTNPTTANSSATNTFYDSELTPVKVDYTNTDFDARLRPWFSPALQNEAPVWTEPYLFHTAKQVGTTVSASFTTHEKQTCVIAFDVLLETFYQGVQSLAPTQGSRIVIFRRDADIFISDSQKGAHFTDLSQSNDSLIQTVFQNWNSALINQSEASEVDFAGTKWWYSFQPIDQMRNTWFAILIPESDLNRTSTDRILHLWFVSGIILSLISVTFFIFDRRIGNSLQDVGLDWQFDPNSPLESLRALIALGEGPSLEFKSTMRYNLHAKKPGKEIEIAWLKGIVAFLNTDGGQILLGVTDDGSIHGLGLDDFKNDDKCLLHFKNLVAQHIGAEFTQYINFYLVNIEEQMVGVIVCQPSPEPAYLHGPKGEAFYIRNGPSSDELPVSKIINYISHRKL